MAFSPPAIPPLHTTPFRPSISLILLSCIPSCFIFLHPWSSTWSRIRAWVPPLREETLPSVANITPNSPPLPPFKAQVLSAWMAINVASTRLQNHHPHRSYLLPSHYSTPSFVHPLLDGENMPSPKLPNPPQPTTNNSSSNHPCRLNPQPSFSP